MEEMYILPCFVIFHDFFRSCLSKGHNVTGLRGETLTLYHKIKDLSKIKALADDKIKSLPNDQFLDWSTLTAFADHKINETEKLKFVLGQVENNVGKGENAGYQHFFLFPHCFKKSSFPRLSSIGIVW